VEIKVNIDTLPLSEKGEGFYNLRTDVWSQRFDDAADLYGASRSPIIEDDDDDNNNQRLAEYQAREDLQPTSDCYKHEKEYVNFSEYPSLRQYQR
jgi:hypothetical protein